MKRTSHDHYRDRILERNMDRKKVGTCELLRNSNMYRNMDNEKDE